MNRPDEPIYVRVTDNINDDINTPEGKTFVDVESVIAIVLFICFIVGTQLP
jgi:hypothetical protein